MVMRALQPSCLRPAYGTGEHAERELPKSFKRLVSPSGHQLTNEISRLYVLTASKTPPDLNNLRPFVLTLRYGSFARLTMARATRLPRRAGRAAGIALLGWLGRRKPSG